MSPCSHFLESVSSYFDRISYVNCSENKVDYCIEIQRRWEKLFWSHIKLKPSNKSMGQLGIYCRMQRANSDEYKKIETLFHLLLFEITSFGWISSHKRHHLRAHPKKNRNKEKNTLVVRVLLFSFFMMNYGYFISMVFFILLTDTTIVIWFYILYDRKKSAFEDAHQLSHDSDYKGFYDLDWN